MLRQRNLAAGASHAFAQRAVRFNLDYNVTPRIAYNHYFGRKPAAKKG